MDEPPIPSRRSAQNGEPLLADIVRREFLQLTALVVVAVVAFLATRAFAEAIGVRRERDAAQWVERGNRAAGAGDGEGAIDAYRRALEIDRQDLATTLALSRALQAADRSAEAKALLLEWRKDAPEEYDVNLQLARLAAAGHDVTGAIRFYNNVLYSPVAPGGDPARVDVRVELARFLIANGERARAASELHTVVERPLSPELRLAVAELLARAGEPALAFEQFAVVTSQSPDSAEAHLGKAETLFTLGRYRLAREAFDSAAGIGATVGTDADVTRLVIDADPLAPSIRGTERTRRALDNALYLSEMLAACASRADAAKEVEDASRRVSQLSQTPSARARSRQAVQELVQIADDVADVNLSSCGNRSARDRALALMAARHRQAA